MNTPKVTGSPAVIWLVYGDLEHDDKHSNFQEVTWCEDSQYDSDVRYVRDDLVTNSNKALVDENKRLKSLLTDWKEFATDVSAADCGGQDWLDGLRGRTKAALEEKP